MLDLIIRGGQIIDGTGGEPFIGDVGIKGGLITAIGSISEPAAEEINAQGAIVTPGFVDIHTHYDGQATWSNRLSPSSHHGVTTVVMGNCGVGFAPVRQQDHRLLVELMEGVEEIPGAALDEGLPWAWESFPDYMDYLSTREFDMDVAAQIPHAALRVYVMGERGAQREAATPEDISEMRKLTAEAIQAGALGFSSSRTLNHRSSKGEATPSLDAAREELVGIGQGLKDAGAGVLEMITDFKGFDEEFETLVAMCQASDAPMTISIAQQGRNPDGWKILLDRMRAAGERGVDMKGQVAPRAVGILMGLTCTLNPFIRNPSWAEIKDLPLTDKLSRLGDKSFRDQLTAETPEMGGPALLVTNYEKMWIFTDPPEYEPDPEESISAMARRQGRTPESLALELLLENDGTQMLYTPFANYTQDNLDCCREMILADNTVMGLGDGGAHVGTICDASFPTFLLTHWGRDRKRGELIDLPTLIKAQTQDTARAVGLEDRGVLAPGKRADVNVIDFENLRIHRPFMVNDLPAGGNRLEQTSTGYVATICHGQVTYRNGEPTDALPGRLIRGRQQ